MLGAARGPAAAVMLACARGLALVAACLATTPYAHAITEQEQRARLEFETREMEAAIEKSGRLYGDPALDAYLQSIVDRLFPDPPRKLRVRAYRDPEFNAFAVATGDLYVNTGALLRMRNEAELASVLGHEGGHVFGDHMYRGTVNAKTLGTLGTVLSAGITLALGFDPALGAIAAYSSMAGFSRDYEREADRTGYERSVRAGYDPRAGARVFARMAQEVQDRKISLS